MNKYENDILLDFKVYCPKEVVAKYNHKHQNKQNWTRFYYYKNKKKQLVTPSNIECDYEVSSTLAYNKNCFYKMTNMSNRDTFFDYYFKLKNDLPKIVVKKSNRSSKSQRVNTVTKPVEKKAYETDEDGKFIVRFA